MQLSVDKLIALVAVLSATSTDASQLIEREVNLSLHLLVFVRYEHLRPLQANNVNHLLATVWTDSDRYGTQFTIDPTSVPTGCANFSDTFTNTISSVEVLEGAICDFYTYVSIELQFTKT